MKISDFAADNTRIAVISNNGRPFVVPPAWGKVLGDDCDVLIAIPDMHMFTYSSNLDNFKYGAQAMLHMLEYLGDKKTLMQVQGQRLRVVQLGDIYEMRFPGQRGGLNATASEIRRSHPDYDLILNRMDALRVIKLYGNHDFEMRHFSEDWRFGFIQGKVYLEHGFAADPWTTLANPDEPLWEIAMLAFLQLRKAETFFNNLAVKTGEIAPDEQRAIGVRNGAIEVADWPAPDGYPEAQIRYYGNRMINKVEDSEIRITLIGHTHHPFTKTDIGGGEHFFIDCGAWTEGRSDFAIVTDEELAVCRYAREDAPSDPAGPPV